jgi:general secretion pathway protein D
LKIFIILLLGLLLSNAKDCQKKLISIKIGKNPIKMENLLNDFVLECRYTIHFKDKQSKNILNEPINFMNIKKRAFIELLKDTSNQKNYFFDINTTNHTIAISSQKTKSYYVDYLNFSKITSVTKNNLDSNNIDISSNNKNNIEIISGFRFWDKLQSDLYSLTNQTKGILINKEAGIVTLSGTYNRHKMVKEYLDKLTHRLSKRVLIDIKIVELIYNENNSSGIDWSQFDISLRGDKTVAKTNLLDTSYEYFFGYKFTSKVLFDFLNHYGTTKLVSNPKILTINNQIATINIGDKLNFQYRNGTTLLSEGTNKIVAPSIKSGHVFAGVTLNIIPQISEDGYIMLKVNSKISQKIKEHIDKDGIQFLAPDTRTKNISTIVKLKNNNNLLIGGLISNNKIVKNNNVKGVDSSSWFSDMFRSKKVTYSKSEMIIIIKPTILNYEK